MTTLIQTQIFFFISSVGFIILGIILFIILVYILKVVISFSKILKIIEKDVESLGDTTKEMLEDMHDSNVFRFLFGHKKIHKKLNSKK